MTALLEFDEVASPPLQALSFAVPAGRLTGLLGQNGAGVETVMALAAGETRPAAGRVLLGGAMLAGSPMAAAGQGVARCARHPRGVPGMTVLEQAMAGGFARRAGIWAGIWSAVPGLPAARRAERVLEARAHDLLEMTGLAARATEAAARLSRVELWRLEIARAMTAAPRLLLLEGPAAALRPDDGAELGALLRALCAEGLTVLVGEHNMGFVAAQCDHAVVLRQGRLVAEGAPRAWIDRDDVQEALLGRRQDADRLRARR